jgi:glycosyltransferase involved in cell wall biosynthesis
MIVVDVVNLSSSAHSLLEKRVLALREAGIDNRIVCMDGPYVKTLRDAGIPVHTVPLPRGLDPWRLCASTLAIARYLRRVRADVVHTHCSVPGAVGRVAAWMARVPVIVHTVHGFHFHEGTPWAKRLPFLWAERLCGRMTDTLLTQNRSDLELAERFGIGPEERRRRIGNGIDLARFRPCAGAPRPPEPYLITCVARFEPVKNHGMLLAAVKRLHEEGIPFRLRLVGEGAGLSECRRHCVDLGIEGVVDFLGYRDDIPALLAESDVAVLTSMKEGIPRAVLEAMAMAVPVVATWVPGTREALRPGVTGLAVELGDVDGLADALRTLLADPAMRRRFGEAGRNVALEEFDEQPIAETLSRIYRARLASRLSRKAAWTPQRNQDGIRADSRAGR